MKTSFLGRKLSQMGVGAAVAGLFGTAAMQAQAVTLQWRDLNPTAGYISLDKLNTIASPQLFSATVNLGVAPGSSTLDVGDTFSETLTLLTKSSAPGGGGASFESFELGGDYRFNVTLNGDVSNTVGAPITLNPDNTVTNPTGSTFDVAFTSGTIQLFDNVTNTHITDLAFQSGGASGIQLVAGPFSGDITLNTLLGGAHCTAALCDPYILNGSGGSLAGAGLELLTITTATSSTRFVNFAGSNFATSTLITNFQDNGQSTTFIGSPVPEPEAYALMLAGLGLIGYMARRRKHP